MLTVTQIRDQIVSDIEAKISQNIPALPKAFFRVFATALAAAVALLYYYSNFIFQQIFVSTASAKSTVIAGQSVTPLTEWGRLSGAGDPDPATAAEIQATATATTAGPSIAVGTNLIAEGSGYVYTVLSTVAVPGPGPLTLSLSAVSSPDNGDGTGVDGNATVGTLINFAIGVAHVEQTAIVSALVTAAADDESEVAYRQRVLDKFQKRAQGGALADYEHWAQEVPGIVSAYPYATAPGQVHVYAEATAASSGSPDGYPSPAQLVAIADSIREDQTGSATRQPMGTHVKVLPITRRDIRVKVTGLIAANSTDVEAQIVEALEAEIASYEPFIGGLSVQRSDSVTRDGIAGVISRVIQANNATYTSALITSPTRSVLSSVTPVVLATDDATENFNGTIISVGNSSLPISTVTTVGVRFDAVALPPGSEVLAAHISVQASATSTEYAAIRIHGESSVDPATFANTTNNIANRVRTADFTDWVPPAWTSGVRYDSPDLTPIVSQIVGQAGWLAGHSVVLFLVATDVAGRSFSAYDSAPANAASLHLTYKYTQSSFSPFQVFTLDIGEKARLDAVTFA